MHATRFDASLIVLLALGGCAQAPHSNEPLATTGTASQPVAVAEAPAAVQTVAIADRTVFWRQLTQRFDQQPFALDYLHRGRGQIVATYDGDLGAYVACGSAIGVAQPAGAGTQRLQSRVIVRVAEGSDGFASVSTDTIHVVSLSRSASQAQEIVAVRMDAPARTSRGRYCWSTGAMERGHPPVTTAALPRAAVQNAAIADRAVFWRQLTQRFDRQPFALDYLNRGHGQIVATYDGDLGTYVACGGAIGVAQSAGGEAQRLQSRVIMRVAEGSGGSASVSTDTIHVVSLSRSASQAPEIVAVRMDAPAKTRNGRYCWSTGVMERLALAP